MPKFVLEPSQVPFNIVFDEQLKSIYLIFFFYLQSFIDVVVKKVR